MSKKAVKRGGRTDGDRSGARRPAVQSDASPKGKQGASPRPGTAKPWEHAKHGEGSATDPLATRFVESLSYDTRLYSADIRGSLAHARMLATTGLISTGEFQSIERGLAQIIREIEAAPAGPNAVGVEGAWPGWRIELEDVHMCIESALIERIGDAGRKLHTGRSRNDQVAVDLRLWLRDACQQVGAALVQLCESFVQLAKKQGDIVMPSYTHVQRAQPIVLGAECMAWHSMFSRDARLVRSMMSWADGLSASPLGSGAVAGSTLPLDRQQTATELGFANPSISSIDATASRDEAMDYLYACSRIAMHLSRLAEQWILYCSTEFSFVTLGEAYTTGSSMMPQKRNPDMLELIRGRCGTIFGHFTALSMILKGLPLAYNRDLQEDKRHVFAAHDCLMDCVTIAGRIVASATFHEDRISETLNRGHLDATVLAEYLVAKGVPFRTAHQVVGQLVRVCDRSGRSHLALLDIDEIKDALRVLGQGDAPIGKDVYEHLGTANVVKRYRSYGSGGTTGAGYRGWLVRLEGGVAQVPGVTGSTAQEGKATPTKRAISSSSGSAGESAAEDGAGRAASFDPRHIPMQRATLHPGTAEADTPGLFGADEDEGDEDDATERWAALIAAYVKAGRTLDDLPYTREFEQVFAAAQRAYPAMDKYTVFRRLHNLRKAGKLPKSGRAATKPIKLQPAEEQWLSEEVQRLCGSLGQRDRLPLSPQFDALVEEFNAHTSRDLEPHAVWRLVAKLAK